MLNNLKHGVFLAVLLVSMLGCTQSMQDTPASSSEITSADPFISSSEKETTDIIALIDYLSEELSLDDYSSFVGVDSETLMLWYINKSEVEKVVEQFEPKTIEIIYEKATYSAALLRPLYTEVADSQIIMENIHLLDSIGIKGNGIEIAVLGGEPYDDIINWLNAYEHNEYFYIFDIKLDTYIYPEKESTINENSPSAIPPSVPHDASSVATPIIETADIGQYIRDNVPDSLYSDFVRRSETINNEIVETITIFCTEINAVQDILTAKKVESGKPYTIIYESVDTSKAELDSYIVEIESAFSKFYEQLGYDPTSEIFPPNSPWYSVKISRSKINVEFSAGQDNSLYLEWIENYEHNALLNIEIQGLNPS